MRELVDIYLRIQHFDAVKRQQDLLRLAKEHFTGYKYPKKRSL